MHSPTSINVTSASVRRKVGSVISVQSVSVRCGQCQSEWSEVQDVESYGECSGIKN